MRIKRRDSEQWMHHRLLPPDLREKVRRYDQYKWLETRGVDEESLVQSLPKDLRRDIKRHLCLNLVRRVCTNFITYYVLVFEHILVYPTIPHLIVVELKLKEKKKNNNSKFGPMI